MARELSPTMADDDTYSDIRIDQLWQVHAELTREKVIRYLTDDGQAARATTDDGESHADEWMDGEDIAPQLSALIPALIPAINGGQAAIGKRL